MRWILALLSLLLAAAPARGAQARRPKIGLVLSGGGARGAAHVGVLKVLEELRVPVDYVVGTSMGSAVGGLYATGLNAAQLEDFFAHFDWEGSFADHPPRDGLSMRRKQDDYDFLAGYGIGMRDMKLRFPLGATQGQVFIGEFRALGGITREYESFDDLPTPFRCLATDLAAAESVVISSGDLALAIRASVAIAPLFTPVPYQGRLLVDGGYLNNIPIDVARRLGAERVIVVNIGTPLTPREGIVSIFEVFTQTARLGGEQFDRAQLKSLGPGDVLLTPELHGMGFVDFGKIPSAIGWGETAAREAAEKLRGFSVSEEEYAEFLASRKRKDAGPKVVDRIEIETDAKIDPKTMMHMIRQEVGQPLDARALQADLLRVQGLGYFDYVDYNLIPRGGVNVLVIKAPRLFWGPGEMRFGLELEEDFRSRSVYGFSGQYTRLDVNSWGGEGRVQANVGTEPRIEFEFFQPLAHRTTLFHVWSPFFAAPRAGYTRPLFDLNTRAGGARYRVSAPYVGLDAGYHVSNVAELRGGVERSWNTADLLEGESFPGNEHVGWNDANVFARVLFDTLDKTSFPSKGLFWVGKWRDATGSLGSGRTNESFDSAGAAFKSYGAHTFGAKAIYSTNLDLASRTPRLFALGGFLRLGGFPETALVGTDRILGQVRYYWSPNRKAKVPLYLGSAVEWGGVWLARSQVAYDTGYWAGTVYAGLDTSVGPVYLGQAFGDRGRTATSLYVGHTF